MDVDGHLREWVVAELGPTDAWTRLDAGRGTTRVWGLSVRSDGSPWIVKQFRSGRGFAQERQAIGEWLGGRSRLGGVNVPQLRAANLQLAALILARLPGRTCTDADLTNPHVHRAAGQFLAHLHALGLPDTDPMPIGDALERRVGSWLAKLDGAARTPDLLHVVDRHGPRASLFTGVRRVACHRDFAPLHWLWDDDDLGVIDFEHARMDLALGDLAKLHVDVWSRQPSMRAAFEVGYGHRPSDRERAQLRALLVVHGLASLAWGHERSDLVHIDEGHRALALAARGPD